MDRYDIPDRDDQGDLFGEAPAPAYRPDPDRVRRRIDSILAELRGEQSVRDWPYGQASFFRMVFPKLTCWLPGRRLPGYPLHDKKKLRFK